MVIVLEAAFMESGGEIIGLSDFAYGVKAAVGGKIEVFSRIEAGEVAAVNHGNWRLGRQIHGANIARDRKVGPVKMGVDEEYLRHASSSIAGSARLRRGHSEF